MSDNDPLERVRPELQTTERYQRLIESVPLTLYTLELHGKDKRERRVYISPRVEPALGISQRKFVEDPDFWLENIHEEDRPRVEETLRTTVKEPRVDLEYRARRADGSYLWVRNLGTRLFDEDGRLDLIVGVVIDIDDLKRAHEDLRRANAELQTLADEMNHAREQAEKRADELAALNRVAAALTNVTDLRASLQMAARELTEVFNTRGSTVTLINESGLDAEVVAEYFTDPGLPSVLGLNVPLDVPAWKRLGEEHKAIIIERPGEDTILGPVRDVMRDRSVSQLLVAPLLSRGVLIGNISVSHAPGRSFAPHEVMLAQTLASPVAQAVENARLFEEAQRARKTAEAANHELARLSVTDALTGLANRRLFHDVVEKEWRRAQRAGVPVAVLMIDIDFFKPYNDEYGHQRGDECLVRVAEALQAALQRAGDFVARYGGEEFVAILPNTDEAFAKTQGERICERVRALELPHATSAAAPIVTVSVGCASSFPAPETMPSGLIAAADHALYEAKRRGRNCVVCDSEIVGKKDQFNRTTPDRDAELYGQYVVKPELAGILNLLFNVGAPETNRLDIVQAVLQGLPGLNQQGKNPKPVDTIKLNLGIPPAAGTPNPLGALGGDLAGYPNGRRLTDDVVDIAIQVVAGELADPKVLGANACKAPAKCPNPTDLGDGVPANDKPFLSTFPYLAEPTSGFDSRIKKDY